MPFAWGFGRAKVLLIRAKRGPYSRKTDPFRAKIIIFHGKVIISAIFLSKASTPLAAIAMDTGISELCCFVPKREQKPTYNLFEPCYKKKLVGFEMCPIQADCDVNSSAACVRK